MAAILSKVYHMITPPETAWTLIWGTMDPCFCSYWILTQAVKCCSKNQDWQCFFSSFFSFCCPILESPNKSQPQFPVLGLQEGHLVWSSAAVVYLGQGLMCFVLTGALLHILVVIIGYLSYCCLPINWNHSGHCPLSYDINKVLLPSESPLTFLFCGQL